MPNGGAYFIWAIFCGAPATLTCFAIHPALGLLLAGATVFAWRIGMQKEREASELIKQRDDDRAAGEARARAAQEAERAAAMPAPSAGATAPAQASDAEWGAAIASFLASNREFRDPANAELLNRALQFYKDRNPTANDVDLIAPAGLLARQSGSFQGGVGCG